jgi:hypothetical protein
VILRQELLLEVLLPLPPRKLRLHSRRCRPKLRLHSRRCRPKLRLHSNVSRFNSNGLLVLLPAEATVVIVAALLAAEVTVAVAAMLPVAEVIVVDSPAAVVDMPAAEEVDIGKISRENDSHNCNKV